MCGVSFVALETLLWLIITNWPWLWRYFIVDACCVALCLCVAVAYGLFPQDSGGLPWGYSMLVLFPLGHYVALALPWPLMRWHELHLYTAQYVVDTVSWLPFLRRPVDDYLRRWSAALEAVGEGQRSYYIDSFLWAVIFVNVLLSTAMCEKHRARKRAAAEYQRALDAQEHELILAAQEHQRALAAQERRVAAPRPRYPTTQGRGPQWDLPPPYAAFAKKPPYEPVSSRTRSRRGR